MTPKGPDREVGAFSLSIGCGLRLEDHEPQADARPDAEDDALVPGRSVHGLLERGDAVHGRVAHLQHHVTCPEAGVLRRRAGGNAHDLDALAVVRRADAETVL